MTRLSIKIFFMKHYEVFLPLVLFLKPLNLPHMLPSLVRVLLDVLSPLVLFLNPLNLPPSRAPLSRPRPP